jgi:hypothetical protein
MKTFIQLKDGIGFSFIDTIYDMDLIEVPNGSGEEYLNKAYIDGSWFDAQEIFYAKLNEDGSIAEICKTFFASEATEFILVEGMSLNSKWVDGEWVSIEAVELVEISEPVEIIPAEPEVL